ncbi:MAG: type II secretion system F family protein [Sedimentisphaerales bacterium]|nr:type II secretion system F family protein [Sedimentisphaerales bacterium]
MNIQEHDIMIALLYVADVFLSLAMIYYLARQRTVKAFLLLLGSITLVMVHVDVEQNDNILAFIFFNIPVYLLSLTLIYFRFMRYLVLILLCLIPFAIPLVLSGPLIILYCSSFISSAIIMRDSVRMDVLSSLSSALRQNLPLSTALASASASFKGKSARILSNTAKWLAEGYSLSESLRRAYRNCPGHIISLLEMAQDVDQLPEAAGYIEQQLYEKRRTGGWAIQAGNNIFMYPFIIMSMVLVMVSGLLTFVVPKFQCIFSDMGTELPDTTKGLIAIADFFRHSHVGSIMLVLLPVAILFGYVRNVIYSRRYGKSTLIAKRADTFRWYCPGLRWFASLSCHIRIIEYFRMSLISGKSLDRIIANCAGLDVNLIFRNKLENWHSLVVSGVPVAQAARQSGISSALAWCFDAECGPGNVEQSLTMLLGNYVANYEYRVNILKEYAGPIAVIVCAFFVGLVSHSIFVPLVEMINSVG